LVKLLLFLFKGEATQKKLFPFLETCFIKPLLFSKEIKLLWLVNELGK